MTQSSRKARKVSAKSHDEVDQLETDTGTSSSPPKLPEVAGVTIAAILNLFRLTGAELVLLDPKCDPERFERAVRAKIDQFTGPATSKRTRDAGLAFARHLVEQVLTQIRAQAEVKRSLTPGDTSRETSDDDAKNRIGMQRLLH